MPLPNPREPVTPLLDSLKSHLAQTAQGMGLTPLEAVRFFMRRVYAHKQFVLDLKLTSAKELLEMERKTEAIAKQLERACSATAPPPAPKAKA